LQLWVTTTDDLFAGPRAETAKIQAGRIAWAISRRLLGATDDALLADGPIHRRRVADVQSGGARGD
jgi:hemoglobin